MKQQTAGWRSVILQHFSKASAKVSRLTVVSDPDELLTEPGVVERLSAHGFEVATFGDPVAFRYAYETKFRRLWDRGEPTHLVVVIRTAHNDVKGVPFDFLEEANTGGRVLSFGLSQLFPTLAPNVVSELGQGYFEVLAQALEKTKPQSLGTNGTRDFALRHIFKVAPELIKKPADLLRVLLRRHYRSEVFPPSFDDRLIEILRENANWVSWPLERIVPGRKSFLTFLCERWPYFLLGKGLELAPGQTLSEPSLPGPLDLPFEHEDVRVYMDNLFVEGLLDPSSSICDDEGGKWFSVGIMGSSASSAEGRFRFLMDELNSTIPDGDQSSFEAWQNFALRWGTWVRLRWQTSPVRDDESEVAAIEFANRVQTAFSAWLLRRFGLISSLPYLPRPVLGHHVPHYLAHHLGHSGTERLVLLVIDGMAIDQWRILADSLTSFTLDEQAIFSWIPTLTQVARQTIFSGRVPLEFAASIEGTYREAQHWANFWQDRGLEERAIRYLKPQGKKESFEPLAQEILSAADDPKVTVIGAVIGLIDQNMHQISLGTPGLHSLVETWAKTRQLSELVGSLHKRGFAVYITADHGNAFGRGIGKPDVGSTAQQRGERAHIFRHKAFIDKTAPLYPSAIRWPQIGLPADYYPLLAPYGACFIAEGKEAISHGGIALEEVMVPFIRISEGV